MIKGWEKLSIMAITYPLNLPSEPGHVQIQFSQRSSVATVESPWTFVSQIQAHQGQAWQASIELPTMKRKEAEEWQSFILKLNGKRGTFLLGDPLGYYPRGNHFGFPVVNGNGQKGPVVNTRNWAPGSTILSGDYLQIGVYLYKALQDVTIGGDGLASIDIWPRLRGAVVDNTPLITVGARGLFRLSSNDNNIYTSRAFEYYSVSITAEEAI